MRVNYHTHTVLCGHARGTEEEYVKAAVEGGMEILGFSEHCTYLMHPHATDKPCLTLQQLPEHIRAIRAAGEKYRDSIRVHAGMEVEYFPETFAELANILRDQGVEYLLLGQHFLDSPLGQRTRNEIYDPAILTHYCDQVIEGMQTGAFTYVAHPDCILFLGDRGLLKQQLRRICREAKACGLPLEINLLGIHKQKHYPCTEYFELLAEEGNTVIFGADAHQPERFLNYEAETKGKALVEQYGLHLVETVPFRRF
ncbi:MAG: histidinol-phosphatase [Oscillospiraceae bacterium]|nr:histidinol-phosphatase [Oscillospiraceae bacterium]